MATWLYNTWTQLLQWFNSSWMGGHNEESTSEVSKTMSSEEAVTRSAIRHTCSSSKLTVQAAPWRLRQGEPCSHHPPFKPSKLVSVRANPRSPGNATRGSPLTMNWRVWHGQVTGMTMTQIEHIWQVSHPEAYQPPRWQAREGLPSHRHHPLKSQVSETAFLPTFEF